MRTQTFISAIALVLIATTQTLSAQRVTKDVAAAHRAFSLRDGRAVLIYRVPNAQDPNATVAVVASPGADDQQIVAADYLPRGSMRPGHLGQVNGLALLDDGRLAVSVGWAAPEHGARNAIVLLEQDGRTLTTTDILEIPARDLVNGPDNTIIALTTDWDRETDQHGPPLVTALDTTGQVVATLFPAAKGNRPLAARQKLSSRLHHWRDGEYMLYRDADETVYRFRLEGEPGRRRFALLASVPLAIERNKSNVVKAIVPLADGSFVVQRTIQLEGRPRTEFTQYRNAQDSISWSPAELYRLSFRNARGQLDGLRASGAEAVREVVTIPASPHPRASR